MAVSPRTALPAAPLWREAVVRAAAQPGAGVVQVGRLGDGGRALGLLFVVVLLVVLLLP